MAIYMCRWENGDVSFVAATSKDEAIFRLDEVGDASTSTEITRVPDFQVHFRLRKDGRLELETFGDDIYFRMMEKAYPILWGYDRDDGEEYPPEIVEKERNRLKSSGREQ